MSIKVAAVSLGVGEVVEDGKNRGCYEQCLYENDASSALRATQRQLDLDQCLRSRQQLLSKSIHLPHTYLEASAAQRSDSPIDVLQVVAPSVLTVRRFQYSVHINSQERRRSPARLVKGKSSTAMTGSRLILLLRI